MSAGRYCECCGQYVKEYKRSIGDKPAQALVKLYSLCDGDPDMFYHINEFDQVTKSGGGDFAKLLHWGLIESFPNDNTKKRTSGLWTITYRGRCFVQGRLRLFKYCHLYNNEIVKFSGEKRNISASLNEEFDYRELMS